MLQQDQMFWEVHLTNKYLKITTDKHIGFRLIFILFLKRLKFQNGSNVAIGYGAEGMITGNEELVNTVFLPESERFRQYYLSFDADLTKIQTKSHVLKTIFCIFNAIKIPAPTFEINSRGDFKFHYLYF